MCPFVEVPQAFSRKLYEIGKFIAGIKSRQVHIKGPTKTPRFHPIGFKIRRQVIYFRIFIAELVARILSERGRKKESSAIESGNNLELQFINLQCTPSLRKPTRSSSHCLQVTVPIKMTTMNFKTELLMFFDASHSKRSSQLPLFTMSISENENANKFMIKRVALGILSHGKESFNAQYKLDHVLHQSLSHQIFSSLN